ncbi:hypothetical protein A2U01_0116963, partial [Trifolium medium]|nr:hypothetical protein [Trifolium medium]
IFMDTVGICGDGEEYSSVTSGAECGKASSAHSLPR